ncbi:MAG TPA: CPP1-like family protein [Trichocoleus sp.]|jgi:hypothetical protein
MSDNNPYERLGVDENASFDEVQEARNRLVEEHSSDRKLVEAIETAYDAILMDRLRMRQEGKIKVPDRIRFPERLADPPPEFTPSPTQQTPDWLQKFIDTPSRNDILLPAGLFSVAGVIVLVTQPALPLAIGIGFSIYFLNRKENKFGRAILLTLAGLIVGVALGSVLAQWLQPQLASLALSADAFAAMTTFLILWLISSFLR